jgi:hypothetical protein
VWQHLPQGDPGDSDLIPDNFLEIKFTNMAGRGDSIWIRVHSEFADLHHGDERIGILTIRRARQWFKGPDPAWNLSVGGGVYIGLKESGICLIIPGIVDAHPLPDEALMWIRSRLGLG